MIVVHNAAIMKIDQNKLSMGRRCMKYALKNVKNRYENMQQGYSEDTSQLPNNYSNTSLQHN